MSVARASHFPPVLGPILETERLILRPPLLEDFDAWAEMMLDPDTRFVGGPIPRPLAWRGFTHAAGSWALQGYHMWALIEKDTGRWVGRCGPHFPDGWPAPEVGWGLIRAAQGKGYVHEAAVAAIDYVVDVLGWDEVIHCIDKDNTASQNVAKRLGSRRLRVDQGPPPFEGPIDIWGQSAAEWKARRG
jgi:RimJ/RimL family protein N-acetyltransferase